MQRNLEDHAQAGRDKYELHNAADEWTKYDDEATGFPYWYNNVTHLSTWEEPATLKAARENMEAEIAAAEGLANREALADVGVYEESTLTHAS